jgi:hypothetical protein
MGNVNLKSGYVHNIMRDETTDTSGDWHYKDSPYAAFQATVAGTGAVTATVAIEVSNDGVNAVDTVMGTITLSGTTSHSDGFTSVSPWKYVRAVTTNVTGTGATVNVLMSV